MLEEMVLRGCWKSLVVILESRSIRGWGDDSLVEMAF